MKKTTEMRIAKATLYVNRFWFGVLATITGSYILTGICMSVYDALWNPSGLRDHWWEFPSGIQLTFVLMGMAVAYEYFGFKTFRKYYEELKEDEEA